MNILLKIWPRPNEKTLKGHMIRGAGGSLFLRLANTVLVITTTLVLARLLGAKDYGIYTYIVSWVSLVSVPATMGFDTLLVRQVARYKTKREWSALKGIIQWTDRIAGMSSLFVALIWLCVWWTLRERFTLEINVASVIAPVLLPLAVLNSLRRGAIQGLGCVVEAQVPVMLALPGIFLITIAILGLLSEASPAKVIGAQALATCIAFLWATSIRSKNLPKDVRRARPVIYPRQWFKSALPLTFMGVAGIINQRLSMVITGTMLGPQFAGILDVAIKGSTVVTFILTAVNMPLAPVVAELYSKGEKERLQRLITKCTRGAFLASLPVALVLIIFSTRVLSFFGNEFVSGAPALTILVLGQLVNVGAGSVALLLNMTGHEWHTAKGVGIASGANVILNFVLIPFLHINGAAIANAVSLALWNVLMAVWVYRKLGIRSLGL